MSEGSVTKENRKIVVQMLLVRTLARVASFKVSCILIVITNIIKKQEMLRLLQIRPLQEDSRIFASPR